MSERGSGPPPEQQVFEPTADPAIPFGEAAATPTSHVSFDAFWRHLALPESAENDRIRELFFEWLGQGGYDVHRRDEPTILGDLPGWLEAWSRYLRRRRLR